jgi:MoaA/NifB/PqqE/SkfB family radical SAM enzyme
MEFFNRHFPEASAAANSIYRIFRWYRRNMSAEAWRMLFRHYFLRIQGQARLAFLILAPTYRCQFHCVHCGVKRTPGLEDQEMETALIKSILDQAKHLGVIQVVFSGGEPLLRDDLEDSIHHARQAGIITRVITNGLLLDRQRVCRLKQAGLTQCSVSIDDADPSVHDRLRGFPGAFAKALEGIKNLKEFDILVQLHTYAAKRNIMAGLKKIVALGRQLGVFSVCIGFPMAIGRWEDEAGQVLTEEDRFRVRQLQDLGLVHVELSTPMTLCRVSSRHFLFVSPNGDLTPCPFVPYVLGNLKDFTLEEIWRAYRIGPKMEFRGQCPMNDGRNREIIKKSVERSAGILARKRATWAS